MEEFHFNKLNKSAKQEAAGLKMRDQLCYTQTYSWTAWLGLAYVLLKRHCGISSSYLCVSDSAHNDCVGVLSLLCL